MGGSTPKVEGDGRGPKTSIQPEAVPTGSLDAPLSQDGDLEGRADATGNVEASPAPTPTSRTPARVLACLLSRRLLNAAIASEV